MGFSSFFIDGADDESVVASAHAGSDDAVKASGDCLRADGPGALLADGLTVARNCVMADGPGALLADGLTVARNCVMADGPGALLADGLKVARNCVMAGGLGAAVNCINNCVNGLGLSGDSLRSDVFGAQKLDSK